MFTPFTIQEKSRAGAKRGQHPLYPTFLASWNASRFAGTREKKNKARPMFPVMPVTSGSVSRVTTSPSMQLCSTTVERAGRERTVLPVALRLHFSRDKTCCRRSAGEIRFPKRKAKRQGAGKRCCRAPTKGQRGGGQREDGMKATVSQQRPLTIMLETH